MADAVIKPEEGIRRNARNITMKASYHANRVTELRARHSPLSEAIRRALVGAGLAAGLVLAPSGASAIGFGKSELRSSLGQPLDVRIAIDLEGAEAIPAESLIADIPDYWEHSERGIDAIGANNLTPAVTINDDGRAQVSVTTSAPINEPSVNFLLKLRWPQGEVVREYSLLLDPVSGQAISTTIAGADRTSLATRKVTGVSETKSAPLTAAPVRRAASTPAPNRPPGTVAATPVTSGLRGVTGTYGPVRSGETLYGIASRLSGSGPASINTMMRQIVDANPHAFVGGDMNRMLSGVTLRVPGNSIAVAPAPSVTTPRQVATVAESAAEVAVKPGAPAATPPQAPVNPAFLAEKLSLETQITAAREAIAQELERKAQLEKRGLALDEQIAALQSRSIAQDTTLGALNERIDVAHAALQKASAPHAVGIVVPQMPDQAPKVSQTDVAPAAVTTDRMTEPAAAPTVTSAEAEAAPEPATEAAAPAQSAKAKPPARTTAASSTDSYSPILIGGALAVAMLLGGLLVSRRRRVAATKEPVDVRDLDEGVKQTHARLAALREDYVQNSSAYSDPEGSIDNIVSFTRAMSGRFAEEAVAAFAKNDYEAAETSINKAIKLDKDRREYHELLACVLDATGRTLDARAIRKEIGTPPHTTERSIGA